MVYNPPVLYNRKHQVLYVGRLTEQKNVLMLIDAFDIFAKKHNDFTLKIYGDGPLKNDIIDLINSKKLGKKISLCPVDNDWQSKEFNSAIFALPSNFEGMPNVLAEALCLGIPSVSTDCPIGGPKELKKIFPEHLYLSKIADPADFARAMDESLKKQECRPGVPSVLSVDTICNLWLDFIKSVLLSNIKN